MGRLPWSYGLTIALLIATMFGAGRWTVAQAAHAGLGADWFPQSKIGSGGINDVTFTDQNTGWAVGDNGHVYVTYTGGSTWSYAVMPASASFQDAAGEPSVTSFRRVKLRVVTRATDLPMRLLLGSPAASFQEVLFTDAQHGYIVGGHLLLTTQDSGKTWQQNTSSTLPDNLTTIAAPTPSTIFVGTQDYGLWASTDGGGSWVQTDAGGRGVVDSIVFPSQNEGRVLQGSELYHTTDGGNTWSDTQQRGDVMTWPTPSNGIIAGGSDYAYSVTFTTDGGSTFTPSASAPQSDQGGSRSVYSIAFSSATQGLLGTDSGIYATSDGGNTWTHQTTSLDASCDVATCKDIPVVGFHGTTPYAVTSDGQFLHYGPLPAQPPAQPTAPPAQPTTPPVPVATTPSTRPAPTQTVPTLTLQSVSPRSIPHGTTPTITINGRGFDGLATVSIGSIDITNVQYRGGSLRFTLPNNVGIGMYDITITEPSGRSATLRHALTIYRPLAISLRALHPSVTQGAQEIVLAQTDGAAKVSAQVTLSNGRVLPHLRTTLQGEPHGQWRLLIATDQHTPKGILRATLSAREGGQHTQASVTFKVVTPAAHHSK